MLRSIAKSIYRALNKLLGASVGFQIVRGYHGIRRDKSHIHHQKIYPHASYAPWIDDVEFNDIYEVAKDYTLVDVYRLYELFNLSKQYAFADGAFLEVGVWRGGSSAVIQKALRNSGNKEAKLYIADTFEGVVKAGSPKDTFYSGGEHSDTSINLVQELFEKVNLPLPIILKGIFPDDNPTAINEKICFLHSDVDAYESTKDIIEWAMPRLCKNAIIVFDDYGFSNCE